MADYAALEAVLGYAFRDHEVLARALRHASYCNEQHPHPESNERLEFLGDAVLDLIVGDRMMQRFPQGTERDLSVTRQQIVSESALAEVAREVGVGPWISVGASEARLGVPDKPRILADVFEAIIGAVYTDGGFAAAWSTIDKLLGTRINSVEIKNFYDFKTRLQEAAQARHLPAPTYTILEEIGADHEKQFVVAAMIGDEEWGRAIGTSKKEAQQRAAAEANFRLEGSNAGTRPRADKKKAT